MGIVNASGEGTLAVLECPLTIFGGCSRAGASILTRLFSLGFEVGASVGVEVCGRLRGAGGIGLPCREETTEGVEEALIGDMGLEAAEGPEGWGELPVPGREVATLELVDTVDPDPEVVIGGLEGCLGAPLA